MPRLAYAERGQEAEGAKPVYDQLEKDMGLVPNIVKLLGRSGPATQTLGRMLEAYFKELSIDPKLREMAYLTVARHNGCAYCQGHHVPLGRKAGLSEAQIEELDPSGFESDSFTPAERALIRFAYETSRDVEASDAAYEALSSHYGPEEITEIAFVVATANFIQRIGKNLGAELEEE